MSTETCHHGSKACGDVVFSTHGQQLSAKDKENVAGKLWQTLAHFDKGEPTKTIAELLALTRRSIETLGSFRIFS
jgi:hypothetical protein